MTPIESPLAQGDRYNEVNPIYNEFMFSGIIDSIGEITVSQVSPSGRRLAVAAPGYWQGVGDGASIAIDGVCLTVTRVAGDTAEFDVVAETLRCTTLGDLKTGSRVNLQKSLAIGDRVDGHFVQGHVDAMATIVKINRDADDARWWFAPDAAALPYIIPKGGIAIDGISLTVVGVADGAFDVALIPTTLARTTLGDKKVGDRVNIETDILARTVVQYLRALGR